jgi:O-antigen/teichoic acid export membrane protein
MLQKSLPIWVTAIGLAVVNGVDLWIVGAFIGGEQVAWYGAASRLAGWLATPLTLVNGVVPPLIATLYASNRRAELRNVLQGTAAAAAVPALFAMAIVAAFSGDVLAAIFGAPYRGAAAIATLLIVGQAINLISGSCATALIMTGHQRVAMTVTLLSSAVTITLALVLVRTHKAMGVAIAAACGLALQNAAMWWMARRTTGIPTHASIPALVRLLRQREPQA